MHPHHWDCLLRGLTLRRPPDTFVGIEGWKLYYHGGTITGTIILGLGITLILAVPVFVWEWLT